MRGVVQRVKMARVTSGGIVSGFIKEGLLLFAGVEEGDSDMDVKYIGSKICTLRIFNDDDGKMNLNVKDIGGSVLVVSQFTLLGDARRGRRPSFGEAEKPDRAKKIISSLVTAIEDMGLAVQKGKFGADMDVELINDGPVTILLDSRRSF